MAPSDFVTYSLSPSCFCFALLVWFSFLFWVGLVLCIALFCSTLLCLFIFQFCFIFFFIKIKNKKFERSEKYKNSVCLCTLVLVYLGWQLKQIFLNFVSFVISCKVFQEFVLEYILLYSTSEYELSDFWLLSYFHLFIVVLSRIAKGGDC